MLTSSKTFCVLKSNWNFSTLLYLFHLSPNTWIFCSHPSFKIENSAVLDPNPQPYGKNTSISSRYRPIPNQFFGKKIYSNNTAIFFRFSYLRVHLSEKLFNRKVELAVADLPIG